MNASNPEDRPGQEPGQEYGQEYGRQTGPDEGQEYGQAGNDQRPHQDHADEPGPDGAEQQGQPYGDENPTEPISAEPGATATQPDGSAYSEGLGAPSYREQSHGQQGYGQPGYGQGHAQVPPPYGPYAGGGFGSPYWGQGPTPPRPTHASGPLMTPGEGGGFGHSAPPPYAPPQKRKGARGGVALLLAAVLAGALAGFAGAAGYDAVTEPDNPTVVGSLQGSPAASQSQEPDTPAPDGSVEEVAGRVLPSVVKIDVSSSDGQGSGSGIILSADGVIMTNNHVVELAESGGELAVSFNDGSTASARIIGTDPLTDIAIIKAEGVSGLQQATLGDSANADVGEQVVAVGSPFGLESTVTSGIVSAVNRPVSAGDAPGDQSTIFPAIQTDAAINPGNSGGALVNMDGEVIGINTAIRSTTNLTGEAGSIGLGFAIPVDEAEPIAQQLLNGDNPTHARLGVTVRTPTNDEGLPGGALVRTVEPGTAAADAGLRRGDVITRLDDTIISSSDSLVAMVRTYRPGDKVEVTFVRDGEQRTISMALGSDAASTAS
jgi:putative serine protease PepD